MLDRPIRPESASDAAFSEPSELAGQPTGLLDDDDCFAALELFHARGERFALVTLVSIEGGAPRHVGAQMIVAESGDYHGYLSGGCLEQTIVLAAQEAIGENKNRLVRYGKGSPYFDVRLPCGSGLDVYFDCRIAPATIMQMLEFRRARTPFALNVNLTTGESRTETADEPGARSMRTGDAFRQVYTPRPRMVLLGTGPSVAAIQKLASASGVETAVWAADTATRCTLDAQSIAHYDTPEPPDAIFSMLDRFTAAVIAFHEHDREPALVARLLKSRCFYIGVLGNHAVHRQRLDTLARMGASTAELTRLRAPIGSISGAKGTATLAIGVMAEILAEAKELNIVP